MNEQIKEFNDLMAMAGDYLQREHSYTGYTIGAYRRGWKRIREFMVLKEIRHYSDKVGEQFLHQEFAGRTGRKLNKYEQFLSNGTKKLTQFQETGKISVPARPPSKYPMVFKGSIGKVITEFIDHKKQIERLSWIRLHCLQRNLFPFLQFCKGKEIQGIEEIDQTLILRYLQGLDCNQKTVYLKISVLRSFMRYTFEQGLSKIDHSAKIPKYRAIGQPKLPSTYSKEEVHRLIASIERSSAIGRRNYAIVLLVARLGLRASDIARLKFTELHWETSTIRIRQVKTGRELVLPILPDVGNAIIDYLKYARPPLEGTFVFLMERPPYGHFASSNVVTHVVQRAFRKSGVDIKGRRFGPHALRHSLGFRMLEESTVLPVISEVLGHESTESTRYYLRIDLRSKKQCILDVPPVASGFYTQKGGVFYD